MPTVSVVIPAYNHARYIREALDSVLAQTHPPLEIIVVDDGSTDDTPQILDSYGHGIRIIRQQNGGAAAARNAGVSVARGELVALLDADDTWYMPKLELQIARLEADPALGLVHCGVEFVDEDRRTLRVSREGLDGWVAWEILRLDREVIGSTSAIVLPKRIIDEVGGFDERLRVSEDWDFSYRVAQRYRFGYVAEPLTLYRLHGDGTHLDIPSMERSMLFSLQRIFESSDPEVLRLKRHSYGSLHRILAGCYFQSGKRREFIRHMTASLRYDPRNIRYFAGYPLRVLGRALGRRSESR